MASIALQFDNVSKQFRKGTIGSDLLRSILSPGFRKARSIARNFYALKDINVDIQQGEIWGIVGNNGAGKSTMLKLASRILPPTSGVVRGYGKVSGILEVGAGFNYELTGKENIYLSGYMLGMTKAEVSALMDDIIDFAGIGAFIDTPIKRYSSGMYLRLAFAVAAFLRTDIMVVDEVLAVGDANFRKQCLGRINSNAHERGTTVLFVSHNMFAVRELCNKGMWLDHGIQKMTGKIDDVLQAYASAISNDVRGKQWDELATAPGNDIIRLSSIHLKPTFLPGQTTLDVRTAFTIQIRFYCYVDDIEINLGLHLKNVTGEWIFDAPSQSTRAQKGWMEAYCEIPGNLLNDGIYFINLIFVKNLSGEIFLLEEALTFTIEDYRENTVWTDRWRGAVRPKLDFELRYKG